MPWQETNPVLERHHFAQDLESGHWTMTELGLRYGISRNTGYKWLHRYRQSGASGLHDHSRAPRSCPHETSDTIVQLILDEHARFGWGARTILRHLQRRDPQGTWPARSTILDILARHGRLHHRRRRRQWNHPGAAPVNTTAPSPIWTIDFKGQVRLRDGRYCHPLTVLDHFSRYLLCCQALPDGAGAGVKPHLRPLVRTLGLPDAPSTPFATPTTSSAPTRRSMTIHRPRAGPHPLVPIPSGWRHRSIRDTLRSGASAMPAPSGSIQAGTFSRRL